MHAAPVARGNQHVAFIDCARGYAILMVITTHVAAAYPELPYPVHRVAVAGWYGVQLFFLASCVTLLRSWHAERLRLGYVDVAGFFIRRFFRIAPAYCAAAVLYYVLSPPSGGFDALQGLLAATFVNGWYPTWTPTVRGFWVAVPGGWSISVEFTFYALFPCFVAWTTSLRRSLSIVLATVGAGILMNLGFAGWGAGRFQPDELENFLFFWFPNQMSVFALGGVLFFLLQSVEQPHSRVGPQLRRYGTSLATAAAVGFCAMQYLPLGHYLGATPPIPAGQAVSLVFMVFFLGLSAGSGPWVNGFVAAMGKVSFSAYLLHFAVLRAISLIPAPLDMHATGVLAIVAFAAGWVVVVLASFTLSWGTFRTIELPMMRQGRAFIEFRRRHTGANARMGIT